MKTVAAIAALPAVCGFGFHTMMDDGGSPSPFGELDMPEAEASCQAAVDAAVDTNGMKNAQCILGNAFTNTQWFYARGEQSPGEPLTDQSIYRLASLGDTIVHMTAWKMIEDGFFTLETALSSQLDFMGGDATVQ